MVFKLQSKHVTKFGSPFDRAAYAVSDAHGLIQMDADIELSRLYAMGTQITRELVGRVKDEVREQKKEFDKKVNHAGVPEEFKNLLQAASKAQVEKCARDITISEYSLFVLIHNCGQLGLSHRARFDQYVPDHLKVKDAYKELHSAKGPKKALRKLDAGLKERRYIHVHLFESGVVWHLFFFSHQDIDPESNHWEYGCHLHYVSYLWPNVTKQSAWKEFNKRKTQISGDLHIKFQPFEFPRSSEESEKPEREELQKLARMIDPAFAGGLGSFPIPLAELATRGMWMGEVSFPKDVRPDIRKRIERLRLGRSS